MGRVRDGSNVGKQRNVDHLEELCKLIADPDASVKSLNVLYAIRTAWAARGYLLDRELLIVRTNSSGDYHSKAAQRASRRPAPIAAPLVVVQNNDVDPGDTQKTVDGSSYGPNGGVSPEDIVKQLATSARKRKV